MAQPEAILERTDRMLSVITGAKAENSGRARDLATLWNSGLSSSLMFSVDEMPGDVSAEREAQGIIGRFLARQEARPTPVAMSHMVELQQALQTRAKVLSAVEMLLRG